MSLYNTFEPNFEQVFFMSDIGIGDCLRIDSESPNCWAEIEVFSVDNFGPTINIRELSDGYYFNLGRGRFLGSVVEIGGQNEIEADRIVQGATLALWGSEPGGIQTVRIPDGPITQTHTARRLITV